MQRYLTMSDEEIAASPIAQGGLNGVPMVDISELIHAPHPTAGMQCVRDISAACREWGFFQVVGHGVEQSLLDEAVRVSHDFFSLPKAEKGTVKRKKDNSKGWFDDELTKQKVDWKEGFDYGTQDGQTKKEPHTVVCRLLLSLVWCGVVVSLGLFLRQLFLCSALLPAAARRGTPAPRALVSGLLRCCSLLLSRSGVWRAPLRSSSQCLTYLHQFTAAGSAPTPQHLCGVGVGVSGCLFSIQRVIIFLQPQL
eukprot:TRINITY_DN27148_c0_g3_i1.p1 TRINITY_DN27148_c0_g3~~TRINITY_DN27148_c0_g3_i1.p1  ORF type:complete len:252 (+),score=28.39 TRINITY_DN27148_c0_g3_i1:54-809(+)